MILIVGYGNDLRGDDGAGLVFAEILERLWQAQGVETARLVVQQLLPELAADLARPEIEAVVFVDAGLDSSAPTFRPVVEAAQSALGHTCSPAVVLMYAEHLYGRRPPAWMITLPGVAFGHGSELSPLAQQGLAEARNQALNWLSVCLADTSFAKA